MNYQDVLKNIEIEKAKIKQDVITSETHLRQNKDKINYKQREIANLDRQIKNHADLIIKKRLQNNILILKRELSDLNSYKIKEEAHKFKLESDIKRKEMDWMRVKRENDREMIYKNQK